MKAANICDLISDRKSNHQKNLTNKYIDWNKLRHKTSELELQN